MLYPHQKQILTETKDYNRCAYYLDMGLGKTFVGAEKMLDLGCQLNLVICQKSKVQDWIDHFREVCGCTEVYDLTKTMDYEMFFLNIGKYSMIAVINYDLIFRRPELLKLKDFTLMLDESSLICNENAKRSRAVLKMEPKNVILLSGTPTAGKYEKLWSQCRLLGWNISKSAFWNSYICSDWIDYGAGFMQQVVTGYKNVNHLKKKLKQHGVVFMKTTDAGVILPEQNEQFIYVKDTRDYRNFMKNGYLKLMNRTELIGDNPLTRILHARQLCGMYHKEKQEAFRDLINSTEDNLVVFYNFNGELEVLSDLARMDGRKPAIINGSRKDDITGKDILFVQYQAGAYGLNLQDFSNKIVYFTLPLGKGSCDIWEQSKKRIHRIGQKHPCFYYYLLVKDTIEEKNLKALREGRDLTNDLFI